MRKFTSLILLITLTVSWGIPSQAADALTLTVAASQEEANVGDEIKLSISLSDAAGTDLSAFSFRIKLSEGLVLKQGSGSVSPSFKNTTGMLMTAFDEVPLLMVSGFGDGAYNGGPIEIASFVCVAETAGTHKAELFDVNLFDINVKQIPVLAVPVIVAVDTKDDIVGEPDGAVHENPTQEFEEDEPSDSTSDNGEPSHSTPDSGEPTEEPAGDKDYFLDTGDSYEQPVENESADNSDSSVEETPAIPEWINPFSDVKREDWFYDYIAVINQHGIMNGTSRDIFSPGSSVTRAMFTRILANLDGADLSVYNTSRFSDVPIGLWYTGSVEWAADMGIVTGVGDGRFDPNANITREQMAVMLYRYMQYKSVELEAANISAFKDGNEISSWAIDAVSAVQSAGIITGRPGNVYDPKSTATRAEAATIFARYIDVISK